jgi:hypothetical protein
MGHDPEGHDALIAFPALPGTGDDAATVDDRLQPVGFPVFLDQMFGRELRGAIE